MLHKYKLFYAFLTVFLSITLCLSFSACDKKEPLPFDVSENAVRYTFPKKNILALKSITVDETEVENQYIFEFDTSSKYITKEEIEHILEDMENVPNYRGRILANSINQILYKEFDYSYNKKSIYLYFLFDHNIDCNYIGVKKGISVLLSSPWDSPVIEVVNYRSGKKGVEGTLYQEQTFDCTKQAWNEVSEEFIEDLGDTIN